MMATTMTEPHPSHHPDFDGEGDTVMSDPHDSIADSPSTTPSSYASSRHEDTDHDVPTTTTTPRGSGAGLTTPPNKPEPITKPHLFDLPRELREKIYAYSLSTPHIIPWPSANLRTHLAPQLLRVCKTIYHEATPVLYSHNCFQFHHPSDANMFLFNYNPDVIRANVKKVHLLIRDREVNSLWTQWISSTMPGRNLQDDYPNLTRLEIRLRSSFLREINGDISDRFKNHAWQGDRALRRLCLHLEERMVEGCRTSIVVHARLPSTDVKTLVVGFPTELGKVPQSRESKSLAFRTEFFLIEKCRVGLELEAIPGSERVAGP
jgi:hypothetical protein